MKQTNREIEAAQTAAPAVGERDLPDKPGAWFHKTDSGILNEWLIYSQGDELHGAIIGRQGHVFYLELPRGGWSKAVPSADLDRLRFAAVRQQRDIQQTLGKALGYPKFCDDKKNFPDATEADGFCVGDHVAESLANETASELDRLRAECDELRAKLAEVEAIAEKLDCEKAEQLTRESVRRRVNG